jgi:signal transduction histidine kinase
MEHPTGSRLSINWDSRYGYVISVIALIFGGIEIIHIAAMSKPLGVVVEAVLPFIGAIGLFLAGIGLARGSRPFGDLPVLRVLGWTLIGMVAMAMIFLWILSHQLIRGGMFHHPHFILVNNLIAGGLIGVVVGTYDARSKSQRATIRAAQLRHEFLNRELRHHILNGMQVILGQAKQVNADAASSKSAPMDAIIRHGEEIVERISDVRQLGQQLTTTQPPETQIKPLAPILEEVTSSIESRHPESTIDRDIPSNLTVSGDEQLSRIFENLVANAVEHNDKPHPTVSISAREANGSVLVDIADNGPGIPDEQKEHLFGWDEPSPADIGMGVGFAIVNLLVERYGGAVHLEDNQPTGTVVTVELPTEDR